MIRLLWRRLTESADARLLRIRRFGFLRFCGIYAFVFPVAHALATGFRVIATGATAGLANLPSELAGWSLTGATVAATVWFAGLRRAKPCNENATRNHASTDAG